MPQSQQGPVATVVPVPVLIYRHSLWTRVFHWINALSFVLLLMSGLQIFNVYPRLHWGDTGYRGMPAIFEISGIPDLHQQVSWVQFGTHRIDTSGLLGVAKPTTFWGVTNIAFPSWMTLPSGVADLGTGMGWHFMLLWVLIINLCVYVGYILVTGRLWRDLTPDRDQLGLRAIARDVWMHIVFKSTSGSGALRYNLLQKLAYLVVLFGLLPAMILTGVTMAPSGLAAFPWLIDLFHGRQSARTLHFIVAWLLVFFVLVHLLQVVVAGLSNSLRSITTGYLAVPGKTHE